MDLSHIAIFELIGNNSGKSQFVLFCICHFPWDGSPWNFCNAVGAQESDGPIKRLKNFDDICIHLDTTTSTLSKWDSESPIGTICATVAFLHKFGGNLDQKWLDLMYHKSTKWAFTLSDRRTDRSVRLVGPTIVSCKRFVRPSDRRSKNQTCLFRIKHVCSDRSDEAFTRYDLRTDQSDRPVGPTGRSDDRIV